MKKNKQGGIGKKNTTEKYEKKSNHVSASVTPMRSACICFSCFITFHWKTCSFYLSRRKASNYWISREVNKADILKQFYASMQLHNNLLNITTIPSLLKIFINLVQLNLFATARNHKGLATLTSNFLKTVYFLPDGKIKLHKHCQQVESSNVFISNTEASKPPIILLLMFGNSCSWHGCVLYMSALKD